MLLLIPINIRITRILLNYQKDLMAKKDIRIKLTNEILQGIEYNDNTFELCVFVSRNSPFFCVSIFECGYVFLKIITFCCDHSFHCDFVNDMIRLNIDVLTCIKMNLFCVGIRVIKFFAWENSFVEKVASIRQEELGSCFDFVL